MKNIIIKVILVLIAFLFFSFLIIERLILHEGKKKEDKEADYLIVLGARLYGDIPSPALLERLKTARDYLIDHEEAKVIVSGGKGTDEKIAEAAAMEKYLIEEGIKADRIIVEDQSTSTFENIKFSKEKIKEVEKIENIDLLLVTNKFHIFRAKLIAKRLGIKAYGLPAKIPPSIIIPSYIREYFAVIKSFLLDK